MNYPTNSDILSPNPRLGWVIGKDKIAAVPMGMGKKYMVIYDNGKMKVCREQTECRNFITKLQKASVTEIEKAHNQNTL